MLPANFIEIRGTVLVPSCIHTAEGAPHLGVRVQLGTDENKIILAAWGARRLASQCLSTCCWTAIACRKVPNQR